MSRYTITPWRTHSDLLTVRSHLYCLDPTSGDLRSQAVSRILAWKLRGNLPHALESTALLVDAILHRVNNKTSTSLFSIRAVHAAAFTRFVTGFCDIGRNRERSLEPSSMLEIARQIGMPAEFVALRHEATHEELPSLQRLVGVTGEALEWLWRVYWSRLDEGGEVEVEEAGVGLNLNFVGLEVRSLLRDYRSQRRGFLKGKGTKMSEQASAEFARRYVSAFAAQCGNQPMALSTVTNALVDDKMIYPADRELNAPMDGAYLLWDSLLLELSPQQSAFLPCFLEALLGAMSQYSPSQQADKNAGKEALHLWLLHIACSATWTQVRKETSLDVSAWLMKQCCLQPGYWSYKIGQALLEKGDSDFAEAWSDLLEASLVGGSDAEDMDVEHAGARARPSSDQDPATSEDVDGQDWRIALMPPSLPIGVV